MVLPGLEGILLHYFGEKVFGARLGHGNKGFCVPTGENSGNMQVACIMLHQLTSKMYLYSLLPNEGGTLTHFVR